MSDQDIKVQTFQDLCLAGDQVDKVPLKKVSRIALNSLCRQESDIEVYAFVFGKLVHCFDPDELEAEVSAVLLPELLKHLDKIVIELKDSALSCFLIDNLKSFLSFANILLNFAEYVYQASETYQLYRTITVFLEFLLRSYEIISRSKATVNRDSNEQDIIQQIFTLCQRIHLIMLHLLAPSDKPSSYFQHIDVDEQFSCLKDVITNFCKIGSLTIGLDNMRCTEAWKAVGKLCSLHECAIKMNDTSWLHTILSETNTNIDAAFKLLLENKEFTKNDMVKLKLINLMLRVFVKLFQFINVEEYKEYSSILKTIITIEDALQSRNLDQELNNAIRQYLLIGYMNIIGQAFRSKGFVKALTSTNYQSTEEITAFYSIVVLVVSKVLSECRDLSLVGLYTTDCHFLECCIGYISRSHRVFNMHTHIYRQLLVHLSAFVLMCLKHPVDKRQKYLEETLVAMVLHDSYWVGLMGLDIWSIYLRYHPVELLLQYLRFWKTVNEQFSSFIIRTKAVFVRRLIHNIFLFLPNSVQQRVVTEYPLMDASNHKFWIAIGLQSMGNHATKTTKELFLKHVKQNITILLRKPTVDNFYKSVEVLNLLSSSSDKQLMQSIEPDVILLWKRMRPDQRWTTKSDILIKMLLLLTTRVAELADFSNSVKIVICEKILNNISLFSDSSKLLLINLVRLFSENAEQILPRLASCENAIIKVSALHFQKNYKNATKTPVFSELASIRKALEFFKHDFQQDILEPEHQCQKDIEAMPITQHISDRIDELFPDDDDEFNTFEKETSSTDSSPAIKRLRLGCSKSMTDIGMAKQSPNSSNVTINEAIAAIRRNFNVLQGTRELLSKSQLSEIRQIADALAHFSDQEML